MVVGAWMTWNIPVLPIFHGPGGQSYPSTQPIDRLTYDIVKRPHGKPHRPQAGDKPITSWYFQKWVHTKIQRV